MHVKMYFQYEQELHSKELSIKSEAACTFVSFIQLGLPKWYLFLHILYRIILSFSLGFVLSDHSFVHHSLGAYGEIHQELL